jgi:hypothetical protein
VPDHSSPRSGRALAWIITLGSLAAFGAAIVPMIARIRAFNAEAALVRYHAEPIVSRDIRLGRFPALKLTDDVTESGQAALRLEYGDTRRLIPVKKPPARDLPNLALYDEWAKVLAINEVTLDDQQRSVARPGTERLLLVVRRTPEGFDPDSWGEVRRIEWVFDFYELRPDGSIEQTQRRWPRKPRSEKRLFREAAMDLAAPPSDLKSPQEIEDWRAAIARSKMLATIPVLKDRTLEHYAALFVMPKLSVPEHKFNDTALSPEVLGWTLPVSMVSVLTFAGGLVFALAPRRRK